MLYYKALQTAMGSKVDYVWLGVWEKNLGAINFYKKNGFVAFGKHIFTLGDDQQTDIMMKRAMRKTFSHKGMIIGEFHVTIKEQL